MMMTFTLEGSAVQEFTQDVEVAGQLFRGVLTSNSMWGKPDEVDFEIRDPEGNVFYEKKDTSECLFFEKTKLPGEYRLLITNMDWRERHQVTLGVMVGGSKTLKTEHITDLQEQVEVLDTILRDTQAESTYLWIRQKNHFERVQSTHSRVLWFFLLDFVVLAVAAWFQVYYVKSLLMDRRFI
ncbi:Transmembrane emp24 domain-containing protein 3 precursor, putative [Perkinsus marinus ATCC 50983]|uniref:Transmembrane emp24 domain-containing protein 3, putative n=1 Tax=Perkinsus marinus (strain ATCC 50983 / TXsc) TaxID=423536 RepID=C5L896_PERM5|nr:Transmembrane emp24 domain-containing protein 3 precursor, putative [Perkinsus marinus ATCC 50983]EER07052.1 Transmembrane emp24 domain-containing protein 3 precursor, putative [Perkinsus marinus ATCC 50983]|eukprot:XP_002775236.1 Transmembrane emp24 domain-containing protein 3 precursor, putative [Perkinsus marinus ATCC 50983]